MRAESRSSTSRRRSPSSRVGEALVSLLDEKGTPDVVERAFIVPPALAASARSPTTSARQIIERSLVAGHYEQTVDRESAYEKLKARADDKAAPAGPATTQPPESTSGGGFGSILDSITGGSAGAKGRTRESPLEAAAKSAARAIGSEMGRRIVRGVLGSILGSKR